MESTVRSPRVGDDVIVTVKMRSGHVTELGGFIEEVTSSHAYFALDSLDLGTGRDLDSPLERRMWKDEPKPLRIGVRINELKPFDGGEIDEEVPCWEVRV